MMYLNNINFITSIININEEYDQPFTILLSICMFVIFKRININNQKLCLLINEIATTSFGIYLFHEHATFKSNIIYKIIPIDAIRASNLYFIWFILVALSLFIAGMLFDFIRQAIFKLIEKGYNKTKLKLFNDKIMYKINSIFN